MDCVLHLLELAILLRMKQLKSGNAYSPAYLKTDLPLPTLSCPWPWESKYPGPLVPTCVACPTVYGCTQGPGAALGLPRGKPKKADKAKKQILFNITGRVLPGRAQGSGYRWAVQGQG